MSAPRLLVTRAEPDATDTVRLIEARGARAILAPSRVAEAVLSPAPSRPDGLLATSARAFRLGAPLPPDWRDLPVIVVGPVTAEAARFEGFSDLRIAGGEARAIRPFLDAFAGLRLVYLAGDPRRPELETDAIEARVTLDLWLRYRMIEAATLPDAAHRALASGECDAILHFSRESVASLFRLAARAGIGQSLSTPLHACLSPMIAAEVEACIPDARIDIAPRREAISLIDTALSALKRIDAPRRLGR